LVLDILCAMFYTCRQFVCVFNDALDVGKLCVNDLTFRHAVVYIYIYIYNVVFENLT